MYDDYVFSKGWFKKHQDKLLKFANSWIGRRILRINGKRSDVGKNRITEIGPNYIKWGSTYEFRTHNKYGKRLYYAFKPVWHLAHFWDMEIANKLTPALNVGFDTLTTYPAVGANSPVDGSCGRWGVDTTWASIIGAAAGELSSTTASSANMNYIQSTTTNNQFTEYHKAFFCFDTSPLRADATISSAVFSLYVNSQGNGFGGTLIHHLVGATLASTDNIVNEDFDQAGSTSFASITNGTFNTPSYNDWTLNASGKSNINKSGISQFALRVNWDLDASFGGTWASSQTAQFNAYFADQTGTTNDPKLVVVGTNLLTTTTTTTTTTSTSTSTSSSTSSSSTSSSSSSSSSTSSTSTSTSTSSSTSTSTSTSSTTTSSGATGEDIRLIRASIFKYEMLGEIYHRS